jgi:two-component system sensor histidine kinase UhpB
LAALVLSPRRDYWKYIVAMAVAHAAAHVALGIPVWRFAWQIAANAAFAWAAAFGIRRLLGARLRFDRLRDAIVFILVAVVAAPAVVSLFTPRFVLALTTAVLDLQSGDRGFLRGWAEVSLSNAMANLTVVPTIVVWSRLSLASIRTATTARWIEAAILAAGLIAAEIAACTIQSGTALGSFVLLEPLLVLLVWAAVSFGAGAVSPALLTLVILASWSSIRGEGPFWLDSPAENVIALQLAIITVSIPLLFLASLTHERRRSERALRESNRRVRELAAHVISAQEIERARIARDLHDDINQKLAALSIRLDTLRHRGPFDGIAMSAELDKLRAFVKSLTYDVRQISHELHPAVIGLVGCVAALRSHCMEFGRRYSVRVMFRAPSGQARVPTEVGLCLYRVAQESLRNIARHASATRVRVQMRHSQTLLRMSIRDDGIGFDGAALRNARGLGLVSMEERVRLLGGRMRIRTGRGAGAEVLVIIPIADLSDVPASDAPAESVKSYASAMPPS